MDIIKAGAILANGPCKTTPFLLFYVFKPIELSDLSEGLYKIQQIKFFEEGTVLFVSIKTEKICQ